MLLISVTCKDKREAYVIASALLEKRLAACANFFPVSSMFLWKGKKEYSQETLLLLKTQQKHVKHAMLLIKKLHSYHWPVIEISSVKVNKEAEQWLKKEL